MDLSWQSPFLGTRRGSAASCISRHPCLGQEKGLLQGLSDVGEMPSLELPDRGVLGDGSTIHLQLRRPRVLLNTYLGPIVLLLAVRGASPLVLGVLRIFFFLLLSPLLRDHLPFL